MTKSRIIFFGVFAAVLVDVVLYFATKNPTQPVSPIALIGGPLIGAVICAIGLQRADARAKLEEMKKDPASTPAGQSQTPEYKPFFPIVVGCIIAAVFWYIAGMAIYNGFIVMGRHTPRTIYMSKQPGLFWADVGFLIVMGIVVPLVLFRKRKR